MQDDYEVEIEFRCGGYLYDKRKGDVFVLRNQMMAEALNHDSVSNKDYRHATPSEKAAKEKQIKLTSY